MSKFEHARMLRYCFVHDRLGDAIRNIRLNEILEMGWLYT